jgi:hypothetical protein
MNPKVSLAKWCIIMLLTIVGLWFADVHGVVDDMWMTDKSRLSTIILGLCFWFSFRCGGELRKYAYSGIEDFNQTQIVINTGYFWSNIMLVLGLLGTIIGFQFLLSTGLTGVADQTQITNAIKAIQEGAGVALYTTEVGLVCSALLKLQYKLLEDTIHYDEY